MNLILTLIPILILIIIIILNIGIRINIKYKLINDDLNLKLKITIINIKILEKTIPQKQKEEKTNNINLEEILNLIKENTDPIKKLIRIIKDSTKIIEIKNHIYIGLEDFVQTAEIVGILYSINVILNINDNITLTTEPNFNKEILIKGKITLKINLLKLIFKILKNKELLNFIKKIIGMIK